MLPFQLAEQLDYIIVICLPIFDFDILILSGDIELQKSLELKLIYLEPLSDHFVEFIFLGHPVYYQFALLFIARQKNEKRKYPARTSPFYGKCKSHTMSISFSKHLFCCSVLISLFGYIHFFLARATSLKIMSSVRKHNYLSLSTNHSIWFHFVQ